MVNRKLIRPNLAEIKERLSNKPADGNYRDHGHGGNGGGAARRRIAPPESTNAEAFYYLKQMNNRTPVVVVLDDGERLRGHIEWYDRNCIKVHREGEPNLLLFKHSIRYVYKQEEEIDEPVAEPEPEAEAEAPAPRKRATRSRASKT